MISKQDTNQGQVQDQTNQMTAESQIDSENYRQVQVAANQVTQDSAIESQTGIESEKVSEITEENVQTKSEVSPAKDVSVKPEVGQETSQNNQEENLSVKRASVAATVVKPVTAATDSTYTLPVQGPISAGFNGYPGHGGIDYAVPEGTPVHAARDGVVKVAGANHPWMGWQGGNAVLIQHPDGMHTGYAHLSRIIVSVGQQVSQGQVIGYSGSTGLVTGPHLHFEMLSTNPNFRNGYSGRIDPTPYISNALFQASPTPSVNRYNVAELAAQTDKTISDGDYHIVLASNPEFGIDVSGAGSANGTNIQLYRNTTFDNQVFTVSYLGGGYYKLIHKTTGKALDVAGGSSASGTNVQLYFRNGSKSQAWKFVPVRND